MTTETATTYDGAGNVVAARTVEIPAASVNAETIANAYAADLANLQGILAQADIPAGTLTTAQLSNFIRTAQTNQRQIARALIHAARYLRGDFSGVE